MGIPAISVVIPAYAYPAGLERALEALARQDFSLPFETLVMDDGSPAPLEPVALRYRDVLDLRYIRLPGGGPAKARNAGARAARASWVAFTDHDCEPAPAWLTELRRAGERFGPVLLGGPKVTGLPENDWSVAHDLIGEFASGWRSDFTTPYFSTNNLTVPRVPFLEAGGFDERFRYAQEDREFCSRWVAQGYRLEAVPGAVVRHSHSFTGRSFCRQHFRYGTNAVEYHRIRNSQPRWTLGAKARFYSALVRYPWRSLHPWRALRMSGILALSQVCYACGYYSSRDDS
ncbi:MAG: glycosyltransferase [Acidobacteriia bacterium]|nr:glycosyltransferase [Terriglobia bacterium]